MCLQVYAGPLSGGARAVVLFNRHKADVPNWTSHNLTVSWGLLGMCASQTVRDLAQQRTPKEQSGRERKLACVL